MVPTEETPSVGAGDLFAIKNQLFFPYREVGVEIRIAAIHLIDPGVLLVKHMGPSRRTANRGARRDCRA